MFDSVRGVFNNDQLYGHFLTQLPGMAWGLTKSGAKILYRQPDAGTAKRKMFFFEDYRQTTERFENGGVKKQHHATNFLPAKYFELGIRRIGGCFFTAALCITVLPLGFAVKVIHLVGLTLTGRKKNEMIAISFEEESQKMLGKAMESIERDTKMDEIHSAKIFVEVDSLNKKYKKNFTVDVNFVRNNMTDGLDQIAKDIATFFEKKDTAKIQMPLLNIVLKKKSGLFDIWLLGYHAYIAQNQYISGYKNATIYRNYNATSLTTIEALTELVQFDAQNNFM